MNLASNKTIRAGKLQQKDGIKGKSIGKLNINDKSDGITNEKGSEKLKKLDLSFKTAEKEDANAGLKTFDSLNYPSYRSYDLTQLSVLILRNNQLSDLKSMHLNELSCLIEVDLSHNAFAGAVLNNIFPTSLQTLDLSGNYIDDIGGFITCPLLETLNLSDNCLKVISALPSSLRKVDLSHNMLHSLNNLRLLTFSPLITVFSIADNPIVKMSSILKVTICSILVKLEQLDDEFLGGYKLRKQRKSAEIITEKKILTNTKQKEADLTRLIEYGKKLEIRKSKADEISRLIDMRTKISSNCRNISPSKIVSLPFNSERFNSEKEQNKGDLIRSTASFGKEKKIDQKRKDFLNNLDNQATGKTAVLNKESTRKLIARLGAKSPTKHRNLETMVCVYVHMWMFLAIFIFIFKYISISMNVSSNMYV